MASRLTLDALQVLDAIDRKGSFAAAAAALYRVPSAVTYSVHKLEEDLGVSLFRREGRRSVLTPAGQVLLEQGRELLDAAERLVETTRQVDSGWESELTIAIDSIYTFDVVFPPLRAFFETNPEIDINLVEEVLGGAWEAVIEGRADLVVGAGECPAITQGLRFEELMRVEWAFVVSPQHPLAQVGRALAREDIEQHRAVIVKDSSRHMPPLTRRVFDRQRRLRVDTLQQKVDAQVAGLGVGFLPRHRIQQELAAGRLVEVAVDQPAEPTPLHLAWKTGNRGRALRWFVERIKSNAKP